MKVTSLAIAELKVGYDVLVCCAHGSILAMLHITRGVTPEAPTLRVRATTSTREGATRKECYYNSIKLLGAPWAGAWRILRKHTGGPVDFKNKPGCDCMFDDPPPPPLTGTPE